MSVPPKPWDSARPSTSRASPLGNSSAEDGGTKPWETASTVVAGDTASHVAGSNTPPWGHNRVSQPASMVPLQGAYQNQSSFDNSGYMNSQSLSASTGPLRSSVYGNGAYGNSMYGRPMGMNGGAYGGGSTYGTGMYGSSNSYGNSTYGNNSYGSSTYGNNAYGGGGMYGAGSYGSNAYGGGGMYGGSSMYGNPSPYGGMYGGMGANGGMGAYGRPLLGAPGVGMGVGPDGHPLTPANRQTRWQTFMDGVNGLMHFFGRVSFLADENAHAAHFFISALLNLLDRASYLYGEIARFVLRLLGYKDPFNSRPAVGGARREQRGLPSSGSAAKDLATNALESAWK